MVTYKYKRKRYSTDQVSLIDLSLEQLIDSDFHLGSKLSKFHKLNYNFIFSRRFDVLILNLTYSLYNLRLALYFITVLVSRRGKVLFFDNHDSTRTFVHFIGSTSRQFYINRKWIAGLLTNFKNFYPAVFTGVSRHFRFSEIKYAGMRYIHRPPNVFCALNIERGSSAFLENFRLGIPTVALVNSNNDISGVTFPIFSNNNSIYTFYSFFGILRSAVLNGYKDEIYKFYRKSLKKILKSRFTKYVSNSFNVTYFSHFFRYYLFKIFLLHKNIIYSFFSFIVDYVFVETSAWVSKVFLSFINYLLYFRNRLFVDSKVYSFSLNTGIGLDSSYTSVQSLVADRHFFNTLIKYLVELFFSSDFLKFFSYFSKVVYPAFLIFFNLFIQKSNFCGNIDKLHLFFRDFSFGLMLFKKWERARLPYLMVFDPKKHFSHEILPFFEFKRNVPFFSSQKQLSFYSYHKILNFNVKNSGFFYNTLDVFKLNAVNNFFHNFKKLRSFKAFYFSRKIKRSLRIFSKRLKFLMFLWRSLYSKKKFKHSKYNRGKFQTNKNLKFSKSSVSFNTTFKTLGTRKSLRNTYNLIMLNYFDEEYEDRKFPFNNEFFFLQVAYGSIFLAREYERNRVLASQRAFGSVLIKQKKDFSKLKMHSRLIRLAVYFPICQHYIVLKNKDKDCSPYNNL